VGGEAGCGKGEDVVQARRVERDGSDRKWRRHYGFGNGKKSAELKNDPDRVEGRVALQVHANLDCDLWFKDLEICEL